jgi:pimeloyl-ACP methyl ester carboxylesterase
MSIIIYLAQILLALTAMVVLASYAVRHYEIGNAAERASTDRKAPSAAEAALCIAGEIGAVFLSVALYPLGFIMRETPNSALHRAEKPIVLCHGYMHNKSAFLIMGRKLKQAGFANVVALNFGPPSQRVPQFAERLSEAVDRMLVHSGCEKVDLIGHSMGGLVVRYYIEKLDGAKNVDRAVALGAPNGGTKTAVFGIFKSAGQFRLDSKLITELKESPIAGEPANMTAIWSDFDSVVLPPENARLPDPYANIMVGGVGHVGMLYSGRVFDEITRVLFADKPREEPTNGLS